MAMTYRVEKSDALPNFSDKCILPSSLLEEAITSHDCLPHPMVYLLNGEILIGVREFTAPEGVLLVPGEIWARLNNDSATCVLQPSLSKASSLRIRPVQFYPHVTNWKYYLESFLSNQYTTLSEKQQFNYHDSVAATDVGLVVDSTNAPSVIVVDTDISLDVVPLNDIMAAQQLQQNSSLMSYENIQEIHGFVEVDLHPFNQGDQPSIFKVDLSKFQGTICIQVSGTGDYHNFDCVASIDQFLNLENFLWTTMDQGAENVGKKVINVDSKSEKITHMPSKPDSDGKLWLYVIPFTWEQNSTVRIDISASTPHVESSLTEATDGKVQCSNCHTFIDKNKLPLHEAFCLRNNVRCTCGTVFQKAVPATHWHCDECDGVFGESALFKFKHDKIYHSQPYSCMNCADETEYESLIELVPNHKASSCPSKLHECQFCHLIIPQGESTFEDRFLNLTHHENDCGNKTAECFTCGKVLRNKELSTHMKIHEMVKAEKNAEVFPKCANVNCINILEVQANDLELCDTCYGPLYLTVLDPDNKKLQARIERRYVLQLTKGCGNCWCRNSECATGNTKLDFKQALTHVKAQLFPEISYPKIPANMGKNTSLANRFWLCVSESMQGKKLLVDFLFAEAQYSQNMIYKAVAARGEGGAREWLSQNA